MRGVPHSLEKVARGRSRARRVARNRLMQKEFFLFVGGDWVLRPLGGSHNEG